MVGEYKFGLTEQDMKVNGKKIKHVEKESFIMLMEMFMMERYFFLLGII